MGIMKCELNENIAVPAICCIIYRIRVDDQLYTISINAAV